MIIYDICKHKELLMSLVMWNVCDANADEYDDCAWAGYLEGLSKPCIGEKFSMMKDHRGPYPDGEVIWITGRVVDVATDLFPKGPHTEKHVTIHLNVSELTKWDAAKGEPVEIIGPDKKDGS